MQNKLKVLGTLGTGEGCVCVKYPRSEVGTQIGSGSRLSNGALGVNGRSQRCNEGAPTQAYFGSLDSEGALGIKWSSMQKLRVPEVLWSRS